MVSPLCSNSPSFFSTVLPGQLPVCWCRPVNTLKMVVLPAFGFPARAIVRSAISLLHEDFDLRGVTTYPLASRKSKTHLSGFAVPYRKGTGVRGLLASVPDILAGADFTGASEVAFNGVAATDFTVASDARIDATVPSGATTGAGGGGNGRGAGSVERPDMIAASDPGCSARMTPETAAMADTHSSSASVAPTIGQTKRVSTHISRQRAAIDAVRSACTRASTPD